MCGIAGIVSLNGVDHRQLAGMTHLVKHRGPSGFGFAYYGLGQNAPSDIFHDQDRPPAIANPTIGLGTRRLAILDLSPLGNMPMQLANGSYCITYNGEIYNYKEIRAQLENLGHRFRSGGDTEVLLHAYQEWGEACLTRFNGMWSFAIWDRNRQILFCARDRFGVKPFYYSCTPCSFHFASEIKQLIHGADHPRIANSAVVYQFLEQGLTDHSSETFFEGIFQLPGGHFLTLQVGKSLDFTVKGFWELKTDEIVDLPAKRACEQFQQKFEDAVRVRLRSDVPVGSSLSGGIDSSAVICKAKALAPDKEFHTFSSCFDDKSIDEREFVSAVVSSIRGHGHFAFPRAESFWSSIDSLLYHHDEPIGSGSVFAQWCVMAEARKAGVTVILGGQGGDEVLCGYQKYRFFHLLHLLRNKDPRVLTEAILTTVNGTRRGFSLADASRYFPQRFRQNYSVVDRLCTPEFRAGFHDPAFNLGARASLADRQKADLIFASLPMLLHYEDRNSMAHSIESRLPFLDYRLVEFAVNCPASIKFHRGWNKWILRESMKGVMPEKVRLRKSKLGFDVPLASWMKEGLPNGKRSVWDVPSLRMERFVSASKLIREANLFLSAAKNALPPYFLFRALSLEMWAAVHSVS
ncbi:MAG TPA: asparagine synthase (glutamine-hydrolyzing) [Candidatus Acidoferrum sp.]|nr:asparagine synthase (glutamine-hydrolyzing) [Candidatus Acidoferrum sp.]